MTLGSHANKLRGALKISTRETDLQAIFPPYDSRVLDGHCSYTSLKVHVRNDDLVQIKCIERLPPKLLGFTLCELDVALDSSQCANVAHRQDYGDGSNHDAYHAQGPANHIGYGEDRPDGGYKRSQH
jgi:hypothetical protein